MKSDVIIIGAELDGLVAATRLTELGHSVRMLTLGVGSLHYAPAGTHILGYRGNDPIDMPLQAINQLNSQHPYQKIGLARIISALNWFHHSALDESDKNTITVSPAGLGVPAMTTLPFQANFCDIKDKRTALIQFTSHRDFTAHLASSELNKTGFETLVVEISAPAELVENAALSKSFDQLDNLESYFQTIKKEIPTDVEIILFPAVMGFHNHEEVVQTAERILGIPCKEVSTLPPSIPGMRLEVAMTRHIKNQGVSIHHGVKIIRSQSHSHVCEAVYDDSGRAYEAPMFIVATGGVLMGGLHVDSHGIIHETSLGLDVFQSTPLDATDVNQSMHALHLAGVEVNQDLQPKSGPQNVRVTGRSLSHWNPAQESSLEGVCIASGWVAAESIHQKLLETNNG